MKAAAKAFTAKTRIPVIVISGPQSVWQKAALAKAGLIYALSDASTGRLLQDKPARFKATKVITIAYMDAILIVRKGNPKNITGVESLINKELPVLVSRTSGYSRDFHQATWEKLDIVLEANNTAAMEKFSTDITIPVWMTWPDILAINPDLGQKVDIESRYTVTRTLSVLIAEDADEDTKAFLEFLESEKAQQYFTEFGWHFRH